MPGTRNGFGCAAGVLAAVCLTLGLDFILFSDGPGPQAARARSGGDTSSIPLQAPAAPKAATPPTPQKLILGHLEVGQVGSFPEADGDGFYFEVSQVLSADEVMVTPAGWRRPDPRAPSNVGRPAAKAVGRPLLVKGLKTEKLVDGKRLTLDGLFEVVGTRRVIDGRTLFVVSPWR